MCLCERTAEWLLSYYSANGRGVWGGPPPPASRTPGTSPSRQTLLVYDKTICTSRRSALTSTRRHRACHWPHRVRWVGASYRSFAWTQQTQRQQQQWRNIQLIRSQLGLQLGRGLPVKHGRTAPHRHRRQVVCVLPMPPLIMAMGVPVALCPRQHTSAVMMAMI
jgi:hypothetical protein